MRYLEGISSVHKHYDRQNPLRRSKIKYSARFECLFVFNNKLQLAILAWPFQSQSAYHNQQHTALLFILFVSYVLMPHERQYIVHSISEYHECFFGTHTARTEKKWIHYKFISADYYSACGRRASQCVKLVSSPRTHSKSCIEDWVNWTVLLHSHIHNWYFLHAFLPRGRGCCAAECSTISARRSES